MREVSCRVFEMLFRALKKKGVPADALANGSGYSLHQLQNKHERIDWSAYCRVMKNAEQIWTEAEMIEIGGAWIDSPVFRHTRLIVGALFIPKHFYEWVATSEAKQKALARGGGCELMFSCMSTKFIDAGRDRAFVEVTLDEGYESCLTFFLFTKGGFRAAPKLFGKDEAIVSLSPIQRGMRFDIKLPAGSDRINSIRRAVRWITAPAAVAQELDDAHVSLQARYEELDIARAKVALQAAQLRTAHTVNGLVQKNLDLDVTLESIANALVTEAGFAGARVQLDADADNLQIVRSVERGTVELTSLEEILEGRGGQPIGKLTVFVRSSSNVTERKELLAFIVPSVAMALDNAIRYLVVEEYRRGLEIRVQERTAELSEARDELAGTVRDLEEAKEVRDRIFANINHDVRSPLSLILLAVGEARRGKVVTETAERTLVAIEHGARRVLRMVDELLILAEGRERDIELAAAMCDLGAMVEATASAWEQAAQAAGLTLEYEAQLGTMLRADPNAIERIVANLISNAIKFTPRRGAIRVRVSSVGDRAILEVRDNGPGIDPNLKSRLFGRFERGSRPQGSAIGGSGLGLSLVKELTEAHGGTVRVDNVADLDADALATDAHLPSEQRHGAIFRVELPLAVADTNERAHVASPSAKLLPVDYGMTALEPQLPSVYEPAGVPRATILLAEDNPDLRDYTARLLSHQYRVLAAPDGIAALALAKGHAPDLLITDIEMPGIDGIELTKRFRALPNHRMAPVLVLTTFNGVGSRLASFDAGAVDYIHKPFEPMELEARVKSQLALRSLALQLLETEKLAALGTLSAGLAHEIRNPANGIINAVGPLRDLLPADVISPTAPAAQLLDIIEHCSRQVASLSRELLGFKRGVELECKAIPLERLLRRVKTTIQHVLEGVEVREQLDYRGTIRCAEPLLAQVLTNLLENGAHAAGHGGWVAVHTGLDEQRVIVEFTDSGPGVPEELRERIFEPFFTTKPAGKGTGLGLSTARDIVLRHGGTLNVKRAADRTVFRLEMPLES